MRIPRPLATALLIRTLSLALPHTFFQPDEFYQAFEPAFEAVFGHGYLSWEWRDLPLQQDEPRDWYTSVVVGGRLRGWIWPGVFALVYSLVQALGLETTDFIVLAPRIVGVIVAALTDFYTSLLATKVLGPGYSSGALFLSLTSLFNAHLLPRALSTSPETLLTTAALYYYPLPARRPLVSDTRRSEQRRVRALGAMDRTTTSGRDNILLAAALAALALCIRPTMGIFWVYLHLETTVTCVRQQGWAAALRSSILALVGGLAVVCASTALDWVVFGRLTLPVATFIHQNIVLNIASFYGGTGVFYHVTQSLPILLFPLWTWWLCGYLAALAPRRLLPLSLLSLDVTLPLRVLARAILVTIAVLSLSPHSEWRFLHPLLPQLLLFALPQLQHQYLPTPDGYHHVLTSIRQYCRLPPLAFWLCLVAPLLPYIYLNAFHGAAQVRVVDDLRRGTFGEASSIVALMPCHSTPWSSHLGQLPGWFLTCEPPLGKHKGEQHRTQESLFYTAPVQYIDSHFPRPPGQETPDAWPSHVVLFGELLDQTEWVGNTSVSVHNALGRHGYAEQACLWNGFDFAQDDDRRRGGVRVWVKSR